MARQQITKTAYGGKYPAALTTLTMTAEDATNHSQIAITDKTVVVFFNSHATTTYTVAVSSVADPTYGRTGNIAATNIAAQTFKVIGPLGIDGWRQTDGNLYVDANNAAVLIGAYETA